MMESAGYEAAAVRIYNHSPEKKTNVLVIIIIITSSKRYCISRKKYLLFIPSLCPKFQTSKNCKKKKEWSNSDIFIPSISKRIQNLQRRIYLQPPILTKLSKKSIEVNGSIFLAIVTVDCEQRDSRTGNQEWDN